MINISKISSALVVLLANTIGNNIAYGFVEEGSNGIGSNTFSACEDAGDLYSAQTTGCNPWRDFDSNFSYQEEFDQEKSSLHYNVTAVLALSAGYTNCSSYAIAIFDQSTDVATVADQVFWAPMPYGVTESACKTILNNEGLQMAEGIYEDGFLTGPDFTYRTIGNDNFETKRESLAFHWNRTIETLTTPNTSDCSKYGAQDPIYPTTSDLDGTDILTLSDLYSWAVTSGSTKLNQCSYGGPIKNYGSTDLIRPNKLGALGLFLHSFQDFYSHRSIVTLGSHDHSYGESTLEAGGFVSNHYAGEFGTLDDGNLGNGQTVSVETSFGAYPVKLHSKDTADAIVASFKKLKEWLSLPSHQGYAYGGKPASLCTEDQIKAFADEFASIANQYPHENIGSSALIRSELADSLWYNLAVNKKCEW